MPLTLGSTLGPYEILAQLGAGGMGEVYRARDTRLGREIALKTLPAGFARDPERLARFRREARTVAGLSHPNIVVLHSIEEAGGTHFLTMELVDGQGLDHHIMPGGLPVARVLELAIALSDALTAAHERGIVHRDLKPANVMLARDGRLKVLDFGLAKPGAGPASPELTNAPTMARPVSSIGQVVGTVPYMAPEQIRGEPADARTDLFAFGILIYELSTGRRPFTGDTPADVSTAILRDTPASLAGLRAELPGELERIVARCLQKEPRDRFQTAQELHNDLRRMKKALEAAGAPAAKPEEKDTPSIAVLPFANLSREEENEYFSDGLAEELLNVLSKIRGLRVAARSSAFAFKGKGASVAEVGRALGVASVLEGSVRKAGERLRISVQLVKVSDGFHLWSERYDRTLDDIFAVQDDIAQSVVKELRTTLLGESPDSNASGEARAEVAAAAQGRGESGEAHRLVLEGRYYLNRFTPEGLARGIACLDQAIRLDPGNALAWYQFSWAHLITGLKGMANVVEANAKAHDAAQRALALQPDLAEAHLALGGVQHWYLWDFKRAEASFRRAVELAPGNAEVLRGLAMLLWTVGRQDEALALARRAAELDPLTLLSHAIVGRICRTTGLQAGAEAAFRKGLDIEPNATSEHLLLAETLQAQGRHEEAMMEISRESARWARLCGLGIFHWQAGRRAESDAALQELIEADAFHAAYQVAMIYSTRGDVDAAFAWLDRAHAQRDSGLTLVKVEPFFRPLHSDPRWRPFLTKMGLAD